MLASIIRTLVPLAVGFLLIWAGKAGLNIDANTTLTDIVTLVVSGAYYAVIRFAEQAYPPLGRWLLALGLTRKQPTYAKPPAVPSGR